MEIDLPDLDDVRFEQVCGYCRGTKQVFGYEGPARQRVVVERPCESCDERGMVLTEVGKRLLEFLARHRPL